MGSGGGGSWGRLRERDGEEDEVVTDSQRPVELSEVGEQRER